MNFEFHYYITYLAARRAGFSYDDGQLLAYACQYVDDNTLTVVVNKNKPNQYKNYISQSGNFLKPKNELMHIHPVFHFLPGDTHAPSAKRRDGKTHKLNTTPDSENARKMLAESFASGNIYRIGIGCHTFGDTWAHQNFVGATDRFNGMARYSNGWEEIRDYILPDFGHADALHEPDYAGVIWEDHRLDAPLRQIDNRIRFKEAAGRIFEELFRLKQPELSGAERQAEKNAFEEDIAFIISMKDEENALADLRIRRYIAYSEKPEYGGKRMMHYDKKAWFDDALDVKVEGISDQVGALFDLHLFPDIYTWKSENPADFHWFHFQEAVKEQQRAVRTQMLGIIDPVPQPS